MPPKLIAISGPLQGKTFTFSEAAEFSIGREPSNHLSLEASTISRWHCLIKREGDQFTLSDLGSSNGTFVNGVPVKERQLADGDRIAIGESEFLLLLHDDESPPVPNLAPLDDSDLGQRATLSLRREDAIYLQSAETLALLAPTARLVADLNALLKISAGIAPICDLPSLWRRLLDLICSVAPVERGAILLVGENPEEFTPVCVWNQGAGRDEPAPISRTIVNQVLQSGAAGLSNAVQDSGAFSAVASLVVARVQSLLAVPIVVLDKMLGVIYLTTSNPLAHFDRDHLQLITAIAGVAAAPLQNARYVEWLESENRRLQAELDLGHDMIGESQRMAEIYQLIARVAPSDFTVLIRGESGTGKELAARAVHRNSPRKDKPFIAINCAALAETLLESELFGHEKGAFTGAVAQKKGKLEMADSGTVFLDEMGEMSLLLQAKLLRALQEREFERVGGTRAIKVDIRVIAATNRDLEAGIVAGSFRQDLFYRLNVVSLKMPALRERREDIRLLANHFLKKHCQQCKRQVRGISDQAHALLRAYDWPGNVRELENAIERALVLGSTDLIRPEDLPEAILLIGESESQTRLPLYEAVKEAKKQFILQALEQAEGNYTEAAKILGIHPNHVHRLMRELKLRK
ncbi:MAG: sigma 54-interacting transcriptional regulator [Blastocatellia bacterium]